MGKRTGRPRGRPIGTGCKQLDHSKLHSLALIGTPINKMARLLGVSHDTLERRFRDEIELARGDAEAKILAKILQLALNGNVRCLELCAINRCNWSNRPEVAIQVVQNTLAVDGRTPEQIKQHLLELQKAVLQEAQQEFKLDAADQSLETDRQTQN